jgi:2-methylcitrate dehydratase PrpD
LLNFVGCALGGAQDEAMGIAVKVLTPFFGPPQGIVIGCGDRPDALNAAFLNAVSANVLEYDDTHLGTVMHPAAPVAPGLFALAELRPVSCTPRMRDVGSTAEEPMVCTTLRWREVDSNFRFRAR